MSKKDRKDNPAGAPSSSVPTSAEGEGAAPNQVDSEDLPDGHFVDGGYHSAGEGAYHSR